MPYIYKITNKINQKAYIGKTLGTIQKRWQEHLSDYKRPRCEKRPLYDAMNKYGIENFFIEEIEEVKNPNELNEREIFWIEYFGTFKDGYNATSGGDGKSFVDYELIYNLFTQQKLCIAEIHRLTGYDCGTIAKVLTIYNITIEERLKRKDEKKSKPVLQIDKYSNEIIATFPSCCAAQTAMTHQQNGNGSHISAVCSGKRKTAYGYKWKFIEE